MSLRALARVYHPRIVMARWRVHSFSPSRFAGSIVMLAIKVYAIRQRKIVADPGSGTHERTIILRFGRKQRRRELAPRRAGESDGFSRSLKCRFTRNSRSRACELRGLGYRGSQTRRETHKTHSSCGCLHVRAFTDSWKRAQHLQPADDR